MKPAYRYRAQLIRVIDGDTVVLDIDVGFRLRGTMPVRLAGINTPELSEPAGKDARLWVIGWFAGHAWVTVETEKDPEKYGRWLGRVYRDGDEQSLNDHLITAGLAQPYMT